MQILYWIRENSSKRNDIFSIITPIVIGVIGWIFSYHSNKIQKQFNKQTEFHGKGYVNKIERKGMDYISFIFVNQSNIKGTIDFIAIKMGGNTRKIRNKIREEIKKDITHGARYDLLVIGKYFYEGYEQNIPYNIEPKETIRVIVYKDKYIDNERNRVLKEKNCHTKSIIFRSSTGEDFEYKIKKNNRQELYRGD